MYNLNPYLELKTKLPKNDNLVPRKELFGFIEKNINDNKMLLVSAPAGYGKTTLVSDWLAEYRDKTVWYTIKEDDNDIEAFIAGIVFGFQNINESFFENTSELLKIPGKIGYNSLLSTFLDELNKVDRVKFLVLDDYHIINNKNIDDFIVAAEDPKFSTKLFVMDAMDIGEVIIKGGNYRLSSNDQLLGKNMQQVVDYFDSPGGREDKLLIEQRLELNK